MGDLKGGARTVFTTQAYQSNGQGEGHGSDENYDAYPNRPAEPECVQCDEDLDNRGMQSCSPVVDFNEFVTIHQRPLKSHHRVSIQVESVFTPLASAKEAAQVKDKEISPIILHVFLTTPQELGILNLLLW